MKNYPQKKNKAITVARRSKRYVLVGNKLYKRGSHSVVLMKCIPPEEGKSILDEIHSGVCGNHAASRTLVGKAFRASFYWPIALKDAEILVKQCKNASSLGNRQRYQHTTSSPSHHPGLSHTGGSTSSAPSEGPGRYHLCADRHRQVNKMDWVQASDHAECRQSHRFLLRDCDILYQFGFPNTISTDLRSNFTSETF